MKLKLSLSFLEGRYVLLYLSTKEACVKMKNYFFHFHVCAKTDSNPA
jgi:hypothetical protein